MRLREGFIAGEAASRTDDALLELFLTFGIPQRDVQPLAKALFSRFGGLDKVLAADPSALLTDYMVEIFAELRRRNFQTHVNAWVDFGHMTGRNQDAIKKTAAGLLKLLHPHRTPDTLTSEEIHPLMELAVEMRQRVTEQLAKILPTEFSGAQYHFKLTR
jgi:hypothetical protein